MSARVAAADYFACTDCGMDTRLLLEEAYQVRNPVWEQAYPGYGAGAGVGESRPCIGCLERRLGRRTTKDDFTRGDINAPDPPQATGLRP